MGQASGWEGGTLEGQQDRGRASTATSGASRGHSAQLSATPPPGTLWEPRFHSSLYSASVTRDTTGRNGTRQKRVPVWPGLSGGSLGAVTTLPTRRPGSGGSSQDGLQPHAADHSLATGSGVIGLRRVTCGDFKGLAFFLGI